MGRPWHRWGPQKSKAVASSYTSTKVVPACKGRGSHRGNSYRKESTTRSSPTGSGSFPRTGGGGSRLDRRRSHRRERRHREQDWHVRQGGGRAREPRPILRRGTDEHHRLHRCIRSENPDRGTFAPGSSPRGRTSHRSQGKPREKSRVRRDPRQVHHRHHHGIGNPKTCPVAFAEHIGDTAEERDGQEVPLSAYAFTESSPSRPRVAPHNLVRVLPPGRGQAGGAATLSKRGGRPRGAPRPPRGMEGPPRRAGAHVARRRRLPRGTAPRTRGRKPYSGASSLPRSGSVRLWP